MWQGVKEEMEVILGLLPLIQSPLRGRHEGAIASDATGTDRQGWVGLGVTYTKEFPRTEFVAEAWQSATVKTNTQSKDWKWAIATKRKSNLHVNVQELLGFLLGLKVGIRHGFKGDEARVLMFNDNQVVVGCVNKGRSSSPPLNALLRRYCYFLLHHHEGA